VTTLLLLCACCATEDRPLAELHYLGHAAFVVTYANGVTVLTDYGASRAYGLDSPVYGLGALEPDIVTRSHEHADHAGGELPTSTGRLVADGEAYATHGVRVSPIPTHERSLETPDNTSYLLEFGGTKILHLGDCQALMLAPDTAEARDRVRRLYPDRYDVVLLPIGYVHDILQEAAAFVRQLDARYVVPMHYWNPGDRDAFLALLDGQQDGFGRTYSVEARAGAGLVLDDLDTPADSVTLVGLTPAPWPAASDRVDAEDPPGSEPRRIEADAARRS
jgi:L-ascorbate metabolism protein UlaG (beta-lactamase superfamily)